VTSPQVRFSVNIGDALAGVRRTGPDHTTILELEAALATLFARTQARVHVDTGSLLASGAMNSYRTPGGGWTGRITYGGPSAGSTHNPVRYAWFEQRRGGIHDFMDTAEQHADDTIGRVVSETLDGRRG
jgi:hypothetical protein